MLENKHKPFTPLDELGEFTIIEKLTEDTVIKQPSTVKGIGDDAAILNFKNNNCVISTDFLIEGVHFNLDYMPLKHLGYKAVISNISDIYAMNAIATQITVSIAASNKFSFEALETLYQGIKLAAKIYNVDIIGGDTTSSNKGLTISITAIGEVEKNKVVKRSGAKKGDFLIVSGDIGAAYLGFTVLERERQVFQVNPKNQPDLDLYAYLIERQLKPEARKDIIDLLNDLNVLPTSMIDISDGLSSEIIHLCKASNTGCSVYENKIPLDPKVVSTCEEFNLDSTTIALNGGEDYELLFTISSKDYDKIKGNPNLSVIGHITEEIDGVNIITRNNEKILLKSRGWKNF